MNVYGPDWSEESILAFFAKIIKQRNVAITMHALDKILTDSFKYGQIYPKFLFKSLHPKNFAFCRVFEFYAVDEEVKKVCMRFSYPDLPVDIIVVISAEGTVITSFTVNKGDYHASLDKSLYEKGDKK
jgi:hypothetical protein